MAANAADRNDVVILYEMKHKGMVKRIKKFLEENGIKVWFDDNNAGIEIFVSMTHIIQEARIVLVCISRFYQSSRTSELELKHAHDCGKEIILLRMDCHEPQGTLRTLTTGRVHFEFFEDIGDRDFFLAITRLTNTIQAILNEGPEISQFKATMDGPAMNNFQETRDEPAMCHFQETRDEPTQRCFQETRDDMCAPTGSCTSYGCDDTYVNLTNTATIDRNPNELLEIVDEIMDKPLKDLPGLTSLSRLMDPIIVVDRVMDLGNLYKLNLSDMQCISGAVAGHSPAHTFLNFLRTTQHNMLIAELRECLYTKREDYGHAFLVINNYTNNQTLGDITPSDIQNLGVGLTILPGETNAGWEYVANYFGYGGRISELRSLKVDRNTSSRFETLCGIISTKFPDHTVRQFLENCEQLHFNEVVEAVENNIRQHAERTLRNRGREGFR